MTLADIRKHFTPGNVIRSHYWGTYDLVLAFHEPSPQRDTGGCWSVTVQHCDVHGIPSTDHIDGRKRNHCTTPDKRDRIVKNVKTATYDGAF